MTKERHLMTNSGLTSYKVMEEYKKQRQEEEREEEEEEEDKQR